MAFSDFDVKAYITANTTQFNKEIKKAQNSVSGLNKGFTTLGKDVVKLFAKGGAIVGSITLAVKTIQKLTGFVSQSVKEYQQFTSAQRIFAETLRVTGAEAWTTADALNAMAEEFQNTTNYTDDEIMQLQTVLLGFKNITGDTFKEASQAVLDMATVMGMDLTNAVQTVGKALDDPVKGLGSLARQGFQFSEAEKQMLEDMVAVGDIAKAQKIILDELNTTYGGASVSGANAGKQLKNQWDDLRKAIGQKFVVSVDIEEAEKKITKVISKVKELIIESADATQKTDNLIEAHKALEEGTATEEQRIMLLQEQIDKNEILLTSYKDQLNVLESAEDRGYAQQRIKDLTVENGKLFSQKLAIEQIIERRKQELEERKKLGQESLDELNRQESINNLKIKYNEIITQQKKDWELIKEITGEEVDDESKLNFYQEQLLSIMKESKGEISTENDYFKEQKKIIEGITAEIKKQNDDLEKQNKIKESLELNKTWNKKVEEQTIKSIEAERDALTEKLQNAEATEEMIYERRKHYNDILLQLRLDALEKEKEAELKSAESIGAGKETILQIEKYYNNLRLEEERNLDKDTLEYRAEAVEEEKKLTKDKMMKVVNIIKSSTQKIVSIYKSLSNSIQNVLTGAFNIITDIVGKSVEAMKNLFKFNPSDALDSLLRVEDSILTFFVETLPELPEFFESAFESVIVTINTLVKNIDTDQIKNAILSIVSVVVNNTPSIINGVLSITGNLLSGVVSAITESSPIILQGFKNLFSGLSENLPTVTSQITKSVDEMAEAIKNEAPAIIEVLGDILISASQTLPSIITSLMDSFTALVGSLVNWFNQNKSTIAESVNALIQSVIGGVVSFISTGGLEMIIDGISILVSSVLSNFKTIINGLTKQLPTLLESVVNAVLDVIMALAENVGPLLNFVMTLLTTLISLLANGDILSKIGEIVVTLVTSLFTEFLPEFIKQLPALIVNIVKAVVIEFPKMVVQIIAGLIKAFFEINWWQVIVDIFTGFIDAIKDFFGIHSPSTVFAELGGNMIQGLWNGIKNLSTWLWDKVTGFFSWLWDGIKNVFSAVGSWFKDTFSGAGEKIKEGFGNIGSWFADRWTDIKNAFSAVGDWFKDTFQKAREGISTVFSNVGSWFADRWSDIKSGFSNVGDWFKDTFQKGKDAMSNVFSNIGSWASSTWSKIKNGFSNVGDWFKTTFTNAKNGMSNVFSNIGSWASNTWSRIKSGFSNVGGWFKTTFTSARDGMQNAFSNVKSWASTIGDKIKSGFSKVGSFFSNLWDKITGKSKESVQQVEDAVKKVSDLTTGVVEGGFTKRGDVIISVPEVKEPIGKAGVVKGATVYVDEGGAGVFKGATGYASGTQNALRGLHLVGEAGPELVKFRGGEKVLNNANTQKALAGNKTNNMNVNFYNMADTTAFAMIQQLKQYNRQMAINGII